MEQLFTKDGHASRVVLFGAHPDDIELAAGGTVARLAKTGAAIHNVIVSVPSNYETRVAEATKSAVALGAKPIVLFDKPRRLEDVPMYEIVNAMDKIIRDTRPDFVFVHSSHDHHYDHGLVNRGVISALRRWPANLFAFNSSYELNAMSRCLGQCFVDITTTIDAKMQAIQCHQSQLERLDLEGTRDFARAMGRIGGAQYAEVFEVLRLRL